MPTKYTEVFSTVMNHLLKQGVRALYKADDDRMKCAYRGDNGGKCAIGCLFPDNEYHPSMESLSVGTLITGDKCPPTLKKLTEELNAEAPYSTPFFRHLQTLHDVGMQTNSSMVDHFDNFTSIYENLLDETVVKDFRERIKEFKG